MAAERSIQDAALDEWLVTNGLGGYGFGTVAGPPARTYHGLLVVARRPPVGRTVIVAGALERVDGTDLSWGEARLDGRRPVVRARVPAAGAGFGGDPATIERTTWMVDGEHTTSVRYELVDGAAAMDLEVVPLVTDRDHHAVRTHERDDPVPFDLRILVDGVETGLRVTGVRSLHLPEETARGQADVTDVLVLDPIRLRLAPGHAATVTYTTAPGSVADPAGTLVAHRDRDARLLATAAAGAADPLTRALVLAADAFLVERTVPGIGRGRSVIAGYPWFNDWGRDTMIALPGLCLATGRVDEARTILRTFARFVRDGLIPNDFPDDASTDPAYHTIDGSLWFLQAIEATVAATRDRALLGELLPAVRATLDAHLAGTRFGIGADPADGLLRGGAPDLQLTWMDAKVDGWVVTPRRGKPVEIQALWIAGLELGARWTGEARYAEAARRAAGAFRERFWRPDLGHLLDVVDGPDGDDPALRPNQLLALALPLEHALVDAGQARSVLDAVARELAVPCGLRSLAPSDPAYRPAFHGDRRTRDAAYHQGAVWTWLIGPYADALARWGGGDTAARRVLEPFVAHLATSGLGSVSENLEPEPPFTPRGCPFQAWGVAEVLRSWRRYGPPEARLSPGRG